MGVALSEKVTTVQIIPFEKYRRKCAFLKPSPIISTNPSKLTRSISNHEAVMERRRKLKVERKLHQCRGQDGQGLGFFTISVHLTSGLIRWVAFDGSGLK
jgi:hypothetical protein